MIDWERINLAFDLLEHAEVMHEFENVLWIAVDKETYLQFNEVQPKGETP